ncbi:hypothetical protein [Novispirillum itersonii]|uniref:Uncharacterized protein n=1 Tax=Novispirillum itersonii TaxID=189 RepID=A0A7W9ZEU5_NOVIT|nr:hypothetical protein [Novispirillum itersonii]MBB6208964.1 hypothetical protein [Novispirillum itersonii]
MTAHNPTGLCRAGEAGSKRKRRTHPHQYGKHPKTGGTEIRYPPELLIASRQTDCPLTGDTQNTFKVDIQLFK